MVSGNYIRTLNIDEPLARGKSDGTIRFYQQDALGSVIALTDENGEIKTTYSHDPFGSTSFSGEESDNPFQFAGRENDGGGHLFERNRYYSTVLQRYISQDPISFAGGDVNLYVRVGNNAVNWTDPLGLLPRWMVPESAISNAKIIVDLATNNSFSMKEINILTDLVIPEISWNQVLSLGDVSAGCDGRIGLTESQLTDINDIFEKLVRKGRNRDLVNKAARDFIDAVMRGAIYLKK